MADKDAIYILKGSVEGPEIGIASEYEKLVPHFCPKCHQRAKRVPVKGYFKNDTCECAYFSHCGQKGKRTTCGYFGFRETESRYEKKLLRDKDGPIVIRNWRDTRAEGGNRNRPLNRRMEVDADTSSSSVSRNLSTEKKVSQTEGTSVRHLMLHLSKYIDRKITYPGYNTEAIFRSIFVASNTDNEKTIGMPKFYWGEIRQVVPFPRAPENPRWYYFNLVGHVKTMIDCFKVDAEAAKLQFVHMDDLEVFKGLYVTAVGDVTPKGKGGLKVDVDKCGMIGFVPKNQLSECSLLKTEVVR